MKAVVIGGGVIGMLQARCLAMNGWQVSLYEQGELGREASWAGGGIISPLYPWRYNPEVTALAGRSQMLYPDLISSIRDESGIDPEFSQKGLLMLKVKDEGHASTWAEKNHSWLDEIDADTLYKLEPNLAQNFKRSLWMPRVASVRNPRLLNSLRAILNGTDSITVHEKCAVESIESHRVLMSNGDFVQTDIVVVCSGAWTAKLLPNLCQKVEPVKGQMIVFDAPKGLVNRVVLSDGRYVIPRQDGKVLAGSTLEYEGFDKALTNSAKDSLFDSAVALFPKLKDYPIAHHWSGLRPGSPKGIPAIGEVAGFENVYVNAGHFRNGLVLAPASVELLGDIIAKRASKIDAGPYKPSVSR